VNIEQLSLSFIDGRIVKCYTTLEIILAASQKNKHILTTQVAIKLCGIYPTNLKTYVHTKVFT
jgi:hypothetical protein